MFTKLVMLGDNYLFSYIVEEPTQSVELATIHHYCKTIINQARNLIDKDDHSFQNNITTAFFPIYIYNTM